LKAKSRGLNDHGREETHLLEGIMKTDTNGPPSMALAERYRWIVLLICWLSFLISFIDRLTWANVAVSAGASLGLSVAALGVFVTAFYVGYVICNALGGVASDRIGGRLTLAASMLGLGVCTFLFGFTKSILMGVVLQVLMGLAAGADYASCIKLIVNWFDRGSRGRAMGILLIASSLGVTATNAIVPTLAASFGWQGVYHVLGIITLCIGVLAFALGHADLLAERLAPGLDRLALGDGGAAALVDLEDLGRQRRQVALLQAGVERGGVFPDETDVVHG